MEKDLVSRIVVLADMYFALSVEKCNELVMNVKEYFYKKLTAIHFLSKNMRAQLLLSMESDADFATDDIVIKLSNPVAANSGFARRNKQLQFILSLVKLIKLENKCFYV